MSHDTFALLWGSVSLACLAYGLFLGLVWAPPDVDMGELQRLMYVHFPSWIGTAGAFSTALIASLIYLATRNSAADPWAVAGVEVGLVFNAVGIVTGAIVYFSVRWWRTLHQPQSSRQELALLDRNEENRSSGGRFHAMSAEWSLVAGYGIAGFILVACSALLTRRIREARQSDGQ